VKVCRVWEGGKTELHYGTCIQYVCGKQREKEHLEYMSLDGRIQLMNKYIGCKNVHCVQQAQDQKQ
jgi:hypothetical protein